MLSLSQSSSRLLLPCQNNGCVAAACILTPAYSGFRSPKSPPTLHFLTKMLGLPQHDRQAGEPDGCAVRFFHSPCAELLIAVVRVAIRRPCRRSSRPCKA